MYLWAKILLTFIVISIIGAIAWAFRDSFPQFGKDDPVTTTTTDVKPVKDPKVKPNGNDTKVDSTVKTEIPDKNTGKTVKTEIKVEPAIPKTNDTILKAKALFKEEKVVEARDLLWKQIKEEKLDENSPLFWQVTDLLGQINIKLLFSDFPCPEKANHIIDFGDSLSALARRYNTTVSSIQKCNNRKGNDHNVQVGRSLSIYEGQWSIKAIKSKFKLILLDHGRVFKVYDIAVGRQNRTPVGTFTIVEKESEPTFKGIKYGEDGNVLGTRWMEIQDTRAGSNLTGYGIHGTWEPKSIGTAASNGCLRMLNKDVEELFDIIPIPYTRDKHKHVRVTIVE